jgi:hypothetical protein
VTSIVLVVIVIASIVTIIYLREEENEEDGRETYSGDYMDYYPSWYLGIRVGDADFYLSEDINLTDPGVSGPLVIYQHRPPELETRQDAEQYLAGFGFNVTGFRYEPFEQPTGHSFSKGGCYIGLVIDGRYSVSYQVPQSHEWEPNITREEAITIGLDYIKNHTVIPEEAIITNDTRSVGSSRYEGVKVESFVVRISQTVDGHLIGGSGGRNSIHVVVDAQTGAVEDFDYHWVTLEPIDRIDQGDRGKLDDIVSSFVTYHNEDATSWHTPPNSTVNITKVEIIYRNPYGRNSYDLYDDCLFYVYMPFVVIEWADGKGSTMVSPLDLEDS